MQTADHHSHPIPLMCFIVMFFFLFIRAIFHTTPIQPFYLNFEMKAVTYIIYVSYKIWKSESVNDISQSKEWTSKEGRISNNT